MEQIVLLLNPCFPLVLLSGCPPPFHLPAVLVKPGPQRHLLSVTGSGTQPAGRGASPHLPLFTMGGRVGFWLLSRESALKIKYQAARELLLRLLCDLPSGTVRSGGKSKAWGIAYPRPGLHSLQTCSAGFRQPHPPREAQVTPDPTTALLPVEGEKRGQCPARRRGFVTICLLSLLSGVAIRGESEAKAGLRKTTRFSPSKSESSVRTDHTSAHDKSQQSPRLRAQGP